MDGLHWVQGASTVEPWALRRVISAASVKGRRYSSFSKIVRLNRPFGNVPDPETQLPVQDSVPNGAVVAVSIDGRHRFSKISRLSITLTRGHGIEGDAHYGPFVRHRYLARRNPKTPNLRQVHLIASELFDALRTSGFDGTISIEHEDSDFGWPGKDLAARTAAYAANNLVAAAQADARLQQDIKDAIAAGGGQ